MYQLGMSVSSMLGGTSRKRGFRSGLASPLVPVLQEPGPMGVLDPVREPRGPAGASWAIVPVRMEPFVPVRATNWD